MVISIPRSVMEQEAEDGQMSGGNQCIWMHYCREQEGLAPCIKSQCLVM